MTPPPVIGFIGPKNAGKTTLIERLLPIWCGAGLRVGAIKHTHHPLRTGDPHADSERVRAAGAVAVLAAGPEVPWTQAASELPSVDFIVCEGYHAAPVVQVLVLPQAAALQQERARAQGWVVAAVAPDPPTDPALRWWSRDDVPGLAAFVADSCRPVAGTGPRVTAAVLAGGASRRMGADKATLQWEGSTWLERVRRAAGEATGGTALVVGGQGSEPWRVPDFLPDQGPLAGLAAACYHTRAPWALLCPCDLPMIDAPALATLLDHLPESGETAAVIPVIGGRRQYTCAAYAGWAWPSAVTALGQGTRGLRAWVDGLAVVEVGEDAWRGKGIDPVRAFADLDDPAAVDAWRRRG